MSVLIFLLQVLAQTLSIYLLVLLVRVLLSWFPNLDWSNPLLAGVSAITDPYLNAFRGLIPPLAAWICRPCWPSWPCNWPRACSTAPP